MARIYEVSVNRVVYVEAGNKHDAIQRAQWGAIGYDLVFNARQLSSAELVAIGDVDVSRPGGKVSKNEVTTDE